MLKVHITVFINEDHGSLTASRRFPKFFVTLNLAPGFLMAIYCRRTKHRIQHNFHDIAGYSS